nr:HEAT repeat domain-containing protein [Pararhodonellum marinum]
MLNACAPKDPVDLRIKQMDREEVSALAQQIQAQVNPELADGLTLDIWAVDSLVFDPISIQVDDEGILYYSRTHRQKNSEFDIRGHQDWEIPSIKLQSIADKRAFLRETLSPERSDQNQWLKDLNQDGSHDWRDLLVQKEQIYRIKDTDGDGLADFAQIMVEDFHEEVTDVAGAVLKHGDDLFVGVGPDLWRLKDKNGDGLMDEKTSISHGYVIHIGFGAHGMSGLKTGPDGRIYWAVGDVGFNGVGPDGREWKYPNRGVVVRANPDGSDFEVFAMGVRNTHEFTFDDYHNLISVDNDGDHAGERERLVYLVNGSDSGWRINWQFGKYRDPLNNTYKVWMDEGLHLPRFEGQAAYITPCIQNYVNGPTGMVYNPGTALSPRWKDHFFVVEFVGNPAQSGIHAFKLEPKGASFELASTEKILGGVLPTGLDFGPDGSLYVADWINGWRTKDYGRIWKLDDRDGKNSEVRKSTQMMLTQNLSKLDENKLSEFLYHEDQRVRRKGQFELAERKEKGFEIFEKTIHQQENQLARIHAIVGISQMARMEKSDYAEALVPLLKDQDPEIRAQAAKWLGDIRYTPAGDALLPLLEDANMRTAFFGAEALGRISHAPAVAPLIQLLERNNDEDAYVRHAASLALARIGQAQPVLALANHPSDAVRMGAVLALRRMEHAGISAFLQDPNEYIVTEAARAIHDDFSIEGALPALADVLLTTPFTNEALIRRSISANLRLGTEKSMNNLIQYLLQKGVSADLRNEAIAALSTWTQPSVLDRVDGRYRGEVSRPGALIGEAALAPMLQLLKENDPAIRVSAVKAMGELNLKTGEKDLLTLLKMDREAEVRSEVIRSLAQMQAENTSEAIQIALNDREKAVRVAGLDLLQQLDIATDLKVSLLTDVIEKRTLEEKQAALVTLGQLPREDIKETLTGLLHKMAAGQMPTPVLLELSEAVEATGDTLLMATLNQAEQTLFGDDELAAYQTSLEGGNVIKGRTLFFQSQVGQCIRCHAYDDMGGNAGPRLNGIAAELSRQELLESLIAPSKRIAPGYGMVMLELQNGKNLNGILEKETADALLIKMGNQPDTLVHKKDISSQKMAASSMPDMKPLLTKREIRDLVSFLATLKEE